MSALAQVMLGRYSTAIQRINYPIHKGKPNPSHGKFFVVGSVPASCWDSARGSSKIYDTEQEAIDAVIAGGATDVQRADCVFVMRNGVRCEPGRAKYEADVAARPRYHDGAPRKSWEQLGEVERWSWGRPS